MKLGLCKKILKFFLWHLRLLEIKSNVYGFWCNYCITTIFVYIQDFLVERLTTLLRPIEMDHWVETPKFILESSRSTCTFVNLNFGIQISVAKGGKMVKEHGKLFLFRWNHWSDREYDYRSSVFLLPKPYIYMLNLSR